MSTHCIALHQASLRRLVVGAGLVTLGFFSPVAHAQPPAPDTATIVGTVANANTRNFLNEAEVKVEGTNLTTLTDRDGTYRLGGLKPGTYDLSVNYTGLDIERRSVTVGAGTVSRQDFNLTSTVYKLDAFTVAAEAEGNAAAINLQKKADHFVEAISADTLGVVAEGNIGEFLKYMPGLQLNLSDGNTGTVSMRGQDPEATLFTIDGQIPAAAGTPPRSSTGSSDTTSRAFEMSQTTIDNIESIEVFKAPPPWLSPATGGVINAVTRNAFSQKGRRISTLLSFNVNSEMLRLAPTDGPGQRKTMRIKPGARLSYSEAFLQNTLGVAFTFSESSTINPNHNYQLNYNPFVAGTVANPVTDDTRMNVNTFIIVAGPQARLRRNVGLNLDYKLGENTVIKLNTSYNYFLSQNRAHTFRVKPGTITPTSTTTDATITSAGVDVFADYNDALSQNAQFGLKVEHRFGPWRIDYGAGYGKSDSKTSDLPEMINSVQFNLTATNGVTFRMTTSPDRTGPVDLIQLAGPDLYNLANYPTPSGFTIQTQPRFQNDRTVNLSANVKRDFASLRFPIELRAGTNLYQLHRRKAAGQIVLTFVGPDGIAGTGDETLNAAQFIDTTFGDKFLYVKKNPPLLDPFKTAQYVKDNPKAFQDLQGTNVQRQLVNSQTMAQDVTAGYVAGSIKFGPKLTLLGGVRVEQTENFVRGAIRINSLGVPVLAAGFSNTSKQYFSAIYSQTQRATSNYTDFFPNAQATYRFSSNLILRGALTRSMSRPGVQTILPNTTVNDTAAAPNVSVNNTGLLPTYSRNMDLELEWFTNSAGKITVGWFGKTITNYIINDQTTIAPGSDNGFDGQYAGYLLNTQDNGGKGEFRGIEISARQPLRTYLKFLPDALRGFDVFTGYTKNYKGIAPNRSGVLTKPVAPAFYDWNANYGLGYTTPARRFYVQVRSVITPSAVRTVPTTTDLRPVYEARHQRWDFTMRYRVSDRYAFELNGANVTRDPWRDEIQGGRHQHTFSDGAKYTVSFQGNY